MKSLLIFLLLNLTVSCAYFGTSKKEDRVYSYLTGEDMKKADSRTIADHLKQEASMAGGNYHVSLFPISHVYLRAHANESAQSRGLSAQQNAELKMGLDQRYLHNKVCFDFNYSVVRFQQASALKSWKLELIDKNGDKFPMLWQEISPMPGPTKTIVSRQNGNLEKWLGHGIACTDTKVPLEEGFSVAVTPAFVQRPFPGTKKIDWVFDRYARIGHEKVLIKGKKEVQKYRGW